MYGLKKCVTGTLYFLDIFAIESKYFCSTSKPSQSIVQATYTGEETLNVNSLYSGILQYFELKNHCVFRFNVI